MISGGVERASWISNDEDIVYILFTSGSTGEPKGVPITKGNLINFASWFKKYLTVSSGKSMTINQAPYSFDLSVIALYVSLPFGSSLLNIDKNISADFKLLDDYLLTYKPDIWVSTPSFIKNCLFDNVFIQNTSNFIKRFIFDGEILSNELAGELFYHYPNAKIINAYGPTESTVAITACEITKQMLEDNRALPIGYPLTDGKVEILSDGKQVEENEVGELFITSKSVANGYWHNPEQTKASFSKNERGCNRYATGDLVYQQNGLLYYIGRKDNQVKLNGYRIELSDIECNLQRLDYIRDCCVVPKVSNGQIEFLCAFVVLSNLQEKNLKIIVQIKQDLAKKIPIYMVPKKIVFLDKLPLNVNGKIDRKKLLEEL